MGLGVGPRARGPTSKTTPPASQQGTQSRQNRITNKNCFVYILVVFLAVVLAVWVWVWDRARARPHIENHTANITARKTIKTETNHIPKPFCVHLGCVPCGVVGGLGLGVGPRARAAPHRKPHRQHHNNDHHQDSELHRDNRTLAIGRTGCVRRDGAAARKASPTSV